MNHSQSKDKSDDFTAADGHCSSIDGEDESLLEAANGISQLQGASKRRQTFSIVLPWVVNGILLIVLLLTWAMDYRSAVPRYSPSDNEAYSKMAGS